MSRVRETAIQSLLRFRELVLDGTDATWSSCAQAVAERHIVHILEHFHAFEAGIESGYINYRKRRQSDQSVPDRKILAAQLESLVNRLRCLNIANLPLKVSSEYLHIENEYCIAESTLSRELLFLIEHTHPHQAVCEKELKLCLERSEARPLSTQITASNER